MGVKGKLKPVIRAIRSLLGIKRKRWDKRHEQLHTIWGDRVVAGLAEGSPAPMRAEHPHPQFKRKSWVSLNGWWDFEVTSLGSRKRASRGWRELDAPSAFTRRILVPFSPESYLSMVDEVIHPDQVMWYRRHLPTALAEAARVGERVLLHFEAVDWACEVYVNGESVGVHEGGYLPFSFDITCRLLESDGEVVLHVCAYDPSEFGPQLRGKQCIDRIGMWYTAQSGIWQPVWAEVVPQAHIQSIKVDSFNLDGVVRCDVDLVGIPAKDTELRVSVLDGDTVIAEGFVPAANVQTTSDAPSARCSPKGEGATLTADITLKVDNPAIWAPENPKLYNMRFSYGEDVVESYCAFRTVGVACDDEGVNRFMLNGEPYFLRGVLDQGYWPDGLMTAPDADALRFDVQMAKEFGFNMARKHVKIESDLWYYECDRQGLLVWQDVPSGGEGWNEWETTTKPSMFRQHVYDSDAGAKAYRRHNANCESYRAEWESTCFGMVDYLGQHPCIVTWSLFNEGWGQFDASRLTKAVKLADSSRLVDSASGWFDQRCGDFTSVHDYSALPRLQEPVKCQGRALVLTEFGGAPQAIVDHAFSAHSFGYDSAATERGWRFKVTQAIRHADSLETDGLSGYVYTQLTDVEEEVNGLVTYDRACIKVLMD